ncbi:MAG: Uma2 family endonuclease, partial [Saprospiraceae bacterium]|nr:Uma2 family endonuclease [Saprospiraceae bacterium]
YPDHVIVCGTHRKKQMSKNVEATINPSVVIEVLSDSTEKYDLSIKARCFKTIEDLKQIVYVRQDSPYVFTLTRFENKDLWLEEEYFEEEDTVEINGCTVTIEQIYRGIVFPNEAENLSDF